MIPNALMLTIAILLGYGFWLLDQLKFMAPYRGVLLHSYGPTLLAAFVVLFLNVFGAAFCCNGSSSSRTLGANSLTSTASSKFARLKCRCPTMTRRRRAMSRDTFSFNPHEARDISGRRNRCSLDAQSPTKPPSIEQPEVSTEQTRPLIIQTVLAGRRRRSIHRARNTLGTARISFATRSCKRWLRWEHSASSRLPTSLVPAMAAMPRAWNAKSAA